MAGGQQGLGIMEFGRWPTRAEKGESWPVVTNGWETKIRPVTTKG